MHEKFICTYTDGSPDGNDIAPDVTSCASEVHTSVTDKATMIWAIGETL